jgi:hypothetical protein
MLECGHRLAQQDGQEFESRQEKRQIQSPMIRHSQNQSHRASSFLQPMLVCDPQNRYRTQSCCPHTGWRSGIHLLSRLGCENHSLWQSPMPVLFVTVSTHGRRHRVCKEEYLLLDEEARHAGVRPESAAAIGVLPPCQGSCIPGGAADIGVRPPPRPPPKRFISTAWPVTGL